MKFFGLFVIAAIVFTTSAQMRLPSSKLHDLCSWNRTDFACIAVVERLRELLAIGRGVINRQIVNFFEGQRVNFPYGWPMYGIPPLDPLSIPEIEANLDTIGTLSS